MTAQNSVPLIALPAMTPQALQGPDGADERRAGRR